MNAPIWVSDVDVTELLDMTTAIDALRTTFALEYVNQATNMVKTQVRWADAHVLHALGGAIPGAGVVGTKTWAYTPAGAVPLLVLWGAVDGALLGVVEATALGRLRTGAVAGVATDLMAAPDATVLAVIGTGHQAVTQIAAACAVRPISQIRVVGRDQTRLTRFCELARDNVDADVIGTHNIAEALDGAQVVSLVTRASEPYLAGPEPMKGSHINAMGAIAPTSAEVTAATIDRCAAILVDSVSQIRASSREICEWVEGGGSWDLVIPLAEAVGDDLRRPEGADLTVFKSMGVGLADVAVGIRCIELARSTERGTVLPSPVAATVDFPLTHQRKEHTRRG